MRKAYNLLLSMLMCLPQSLVHYHFTSMLLCRQCLSIESKLSAITTASWKHILQPKKSYLRQVKRHQQCLCRESLQLQRGPWTAVLSIPPPASHLQSCQKSLPSGFRAAQRMEEFRANEDLYQCISPPSSWSNKTHYLK